MTELRTTPKATAPICGAKVLAFPLRLPAPLAPRRAPRGPAPLAPERVQSGQFCGIHYVARQLRLQSCDLRTVVSHVRAHVERSGFPMPVTSRLRHGLPITGGDAVSPKSEWLRTAVDHWIARRHSGQANPGQDSPGPDNPDQRRADRIDAALAARLAGQQEPVA